MLSKRIFTSIEHFCLCGAEAEKYHAAAGENAYKPNPYEERCCVAEAEKAHSIRLLTILRKLMLAIIGLLIFILALSLLKDGARSYGQSLITMLHISNPVNTLGFGWLLALSLIHILAVILARQARGMVAQPHRRRAFWLAALGLLLFTAFNLTLAYNQPLGMIQNALAIGGFVLFVASFVSLFISFRSGERKADQQRFADAARAFREERERIVDERKSGDAVSYTHLDVYKRQHCARSREHLHV